MAAQQHTQQQAQSMAEFEQQLRDKAQKGDPVACFQIVEHFERKALAANKLEAQNRINLLLEASNKGVGAASLLLGRWYLNGHYVNKDPAKAILFFEHAGNVCKDSYGYYQLAEMFQTGVGVKAHPEKGLEYLKKAVDLHNPDAIFTYASQVLKTDADKALQLLKDNYKKQHHVRSLLFLNDSPEVDQSKVQTFLENQHQNDPLISALLAFRYLNQGKIEQAKQLADYAARQNNAVGCHVRALIELQDEHGSQELAQQWMLKAAQLGHVDASYRVGISLLAQAEQQNDPALEEKIVHQALQFIAQAAQAGFAPAQFSLGQCWLQGIGVEKNQQEGLGWIERAAQQGHVDAMFTLALNLPVDHAQHLPLLQAAAQAGHAKAMLCVGLYLQNHAQPEQAVEWFKHAKERGDLRADFMLGMAYLTGNGVAADAKHAVEVLNQAGEAGDIDAYFALYQAYRDGNGVRKNKKSQAKYLKLAQQGNHPEALKIEQA
ncbi:tetratricopeptide repeat protein [Acinetobacter puyangensis]|uniref:TPR repeat n=1 Tax=Acinetobacter puyangensis TaxID=1096779 RepID=A0A240EC47_9GAMM|nr:SEL1-like repeat protein [Acinetobacter puyangensis]SNX46121.1 TPR repeat [Acinetobacter puyangensis]